MELTILHTNDIHSNIENFAKLVKEIEKLKDENTIILDAGDFADFKRLELQGTNGLAALEFLEHAGYDAITIGNNETFNGLDTLINMAANSEVPFISSNLYKLDNTDIDGVKRSTIIEKNGLRILVVGSSPDLGEFTTLAGLRAVNYLDAIREEILAQKGKYDLCIVLSHLGIDKDRNIARELEEVDIIIGGHFHILMDDPEVINNTIIHTSGAYGENLGFLKINFDEEELRLIHSQNINVTEQESSEQLLEILKANKEKAIINLSKPLYYIDTDLWHDVVEENPITNLLADALLDLFKCDLAFINSGIVNGGIRKGAVSLKKLLELSPSPLNPTSFEMQGKYLREALENSLDTDFCYLEGKGPGFRGKYLGRLHVSSNALIEHDGRRIKAILINGEPLDDERWYTVASSDYLQRGTGYTSLKNNKNEAYRGEYLRDTLREYAEKKEFVDKAFIDRWILK